jgi:hypothetical protein
MEPRQLILLSPYRYPGQTPLVLAEDDLACWLNAYTLLWHPALLWQAAGPPSIEMAYDHEYPRPGVVYAVPQTPPLFLPTDWPERLLRAGATALPVTANRRETLAEWSRSWKEPQADPVRARLRDLPTEQLAPFFALGLGFLLLGSLSEALEHESLLETERFWRHVQQAVAALAGVPDCLWADGEACPQDADAPTEPSPEAEQTDDADLSAEPWRRHLQQAAHLLQHSREILYPSNIYLLDIFLLETETLSGPWPTSFAQQMPLNIVASAALLEQLQQQAPERLEVLRQRLAAEQAEVCTGCYLEREDALLPLESQLWNLRQGLAVARQLLGQEVRVFARRRFAVHPHWPMLLNSNGLTRALLLSFDGAALPGYHAPVINLASSDGRQVDAFVRTPLPAARAETWFHLGHQLFKTIREDHIATLAFLHRREPAPAWYEDFLQLARFGPIFGRWLTFSQYFAETQAGEYTPPLSPDDLSYDYLSERAPAEPLPEEAASRPRAPAPSSSWPVSGFAHFQRLRRQVDTCWTLAGFLGGLGEPSVRGGDTLALLQQLEAEVERAGPDRAAEVGELRQRLESCAQQLGQALAERLLARAPAGQAGWLLLNPCSFPRRVALELPGDRAPLPLVSPVKACQLEGQTLRLVVEVPALGFAWVPRSGPAGAPPPPTRLRLADERHVRNEFFEAEIDPLTGGLRSLCDRRTGVPRLGQRLVFGPGSSMQATALRTTSQGPALGEVVTEGHLLDAQQRVLARFRQRFRAWLGRPLLELHIELEPQQPLSGSPWENYFAARFAWRDEQALLLRGVTGMGYVTTHLRPQTPDYLEIRLDPFRTTLFPGGLPFHRRRNGRMLDILLLTPGEQERVFELGIGLERDYPMQTALGLISPVVVCPVDRGPPHVGPVGWLFHLDAAGVLLTSLRPGVSEPAPATHSAGGGGDAVTARLLECTGQSLTAQWRCVRNPRRALLLDARGICLREVTLQGDAVLFEIAPGEWLQLQAEFT